MKSRISTRLIAALLAFVMIAAMVPAGSLSVLAADVTTLIEHDDWELLGMGYNLLGDSRLSSGALVTNSPIFDDSVVDYVTSKKVTGSDASYSYTYIKSMDSYLKKQSESISTSIGVSGKIKMLSLGLKTSMGLETASSESSESTKEYAVLKASQKIATYYMDLNSMTKLRSLWSNNAVNSEFKENAYDVNAGITVADFISMYGTHILTGYAEGGEAVVTYSGSSLSEAFGASLKADSEITASAGVSGLMTAETTIKSSYEIDASGKSSTSDVSVYGKALGAGKALEGSFSSGGFSEAAVNNFFGAITHETAEVMLDESLRLLPIWDLLIASGDDSLITAGKAIEEYYYNNIDLQCADFYDDYLNSVYNSDDIDEDVDEWTRYSDTKIIATAEDLNNIRNDLDGIYVLANNIDLSEYENWTPIGTKEAPFMGKLYGNYNTVSGLNITESSNGYAGLFGYNSGLISNLKVSGNISVVASPENFIGGIAAYNAERGEIKNCYDNVIYDVEYASVSDLNIPVRDIYLSSESAQPITIGDEIGVRLIGQEGTTYTGFNIVIEDAGVESPAYIILENANIVGSSANGTIYSNNDRPIYIISTGASNSITGAVNAVAINISNTTASLFGDAELTVKGGNGTTAGDKNGTAGAASIIVDNLIVDMNGELTVVGGNGGNGATGNAGGYKQVGEKGGEGGNGGMAISCQSVSIINPNAQAHIIGGNGGRGGNGGYVADGIDGDGQYNIPDAGNGGNGGNGGAPILVSSLNSLICSSLELKYGNGGDGGDGGKGGDPRVCDHSADGWSNGGDGGNGGNGFVAGNGGRGGNGGGSYGEGHFDNTRSTAGDGGDGGDGGDKIYGVLYAFGVIQSLITSETCGKSGGAGYGGPVLDYGQEVAGHWGSDGSYGTAGAIDDSFYDEFNSSIILQDNVSEKRLLNGILSGYSNSSNISAINQSSWNNNIVAIDAVTKTEYYSGDTFERNTAKILVDGKEIADYAYVFNSYCADDVTSRTGYIKIVSEGCERYIPVHVTRTVPISIEVAKTGQTEFVKGTKFDITGLSLAVTYNNGDVKYITESEKGVSYTVPSTESSGLTLPVVISYDHDSDESTPALTASYDIHTVGVKTTGIAINVYPISRYEQGESLNIDGIELVLFTNDGGKKIITKDEILSTYKESINFDINPSMCNVGTSTVTISYDQYETTYEIEVVASDNFDHAWDEGVVTTAATHTSTGVMTYTCKVDNCGATKTEDIRPIEGHTYGEWYRLNAEQHQRICECGDTVEREHSWNDGKVILSETHTTKGEMIYTCNDCGETKTEVIEPTKEHHYGEWVDYNDTQHTRSCECGEVEYADHDWDDGVETLAPTYNEEGLETFTCNDCKKTQTEIIPTREIPEDAPQIIVESKTATPGSTVQLSIIMKNNPGIAGIVLTLKYDTDVFSVVDVTNGEVMSTMTSATNLVFNNTLDSTTNGVLAKVTFSVDEDAELGDYSIDCIVRECSNTSLESISLASRSGSLPIISFVYGDVDGNEVVNLNDSILLRTYLATYDYDTGTSTTDVAAGADADGNQIINLNDAVLLNNYLANYDYDTGKSSIVLGPIS